MKIEITTTSGNIFELYHEELKAFNLKKSQTDYATVEINSIEDLIELSKSVRCEIVLDSNPTIEIYNDYRE